ncbi:MAG: hypothetical protein KAH22_09185 [Thiotrichaceae bacterium]|nr:hypothetical protein [Thiotrichaceae bacterium]
MIKKSTIGLSLVSILFLGILIVMMTGGFSPQPQQRDHVHLPWLINADDDNQTKVISLSIGSQTFSEVVHTLRKLPELAIFETPKGERTIEGFFSKVRQGVLLANLVVEVDITGKNLAPLARLEQKGEPTPSGLWRWNLSKTGIVTVNQWRVWKLAYIPTTQYSTEQLLKFFGQPESKKMLGNDVKLWRYSAKGLIITEDSEGRTIFYYSSRKDFLRLEKSLSIITTPI